YGDIFAAHAGLIEDPALLKEIETLICQRGHAAEYAVSLVIRRQAKAVQSLEEGHFKSHASDLFDIEKMLLRHLLSKPRELLQHLKGPVVILAHDLTPSDTASIDPKMVYAFGPEAGGRACHPAIVAGVLGIPAVVGVGRFLTDVPGGDEVIVDG